MLFSKLEIVSELAVTFITALAIHQVPVHTQIKYRGGARFTAELGKAESASARVLSKAGGSLSQGVHLCQEPQLQAVS